MKCSLLNPLLPTWAWSLFDSYLLVLPCSWQWGSALFNGMKGWARATEIGCLFRVEHFLSPAFALFPVRLYCPSWCCRVSGSKNKSPVVFNPLSGAVTAHEKDASCCGSSVCEHRCSLATRSWNICPRFHRNGVHFLSPTFRGLK